MNLLVCKLTRLEAELEMRTAALEASVSAAAGVSLTKSSTGPGGSGGTLSSKGSSVEVNGALDLAALLGVEETAKGSKGVLNNNNNGANSQINVQMISILQSQRDQYKDKLTRVKLLFSLCIICYNYMFVFQIGVVVVEVFKDSNISKCESILSFLTYKSISYFDSSYYSFNIHFTRRRLRCNVCKWTWRQPRAPRPVWRPTTSLCIAKFDICKATEAEEGARCTSHRRYIRVQMYISAGPFLYCAKF